MYLLNFSSLPGYIAIISLILVVIMLIFSLIGFVDTDIDGIDGGDLSGGDFDISTIISPKGFLHFLLGSSWYLVLIQPTRPNGVWLYYDWIIAIIVGVVLALMMAGIYFFMNKLACEKKKESGEELVGRSVTIYLHTKGGSYDARVKYSGMTTTIPVVSLSGYDKYQVGEQIEIVKYEKGIYYIV